ncbi:MAG: hypothetical protein V1694_01455 [Candidatus Eisenbacteria bacterium]
MSTGTMGTGLGEPAYDVELQYDPTDDAEERLLRVYQFLLGLPEASEIDLAGRELTCYVPGTIRVCSMAMEGRGT